MTVSLADAAWLQAQYRQACRAAADARGARWQGWGRNNPNDLRHVSATARMCALGEVMQRLGVPVPTSAGEPVTTDS